MSENIQTIYHCNATKTVLRAMVEDTGGSDKPPLVIYGKSGCGKTTHREALAKAFGYKVVLDGFFPYEWVEAVPVILDNLTPGKPAYLPDGVLALSDQPHDVYTSIPFDEAMKKVSQ